jgi:hypothetical protein
VRSQKVSWCGCEEVRSSLTGCIGYWFGSAFGKQATDHRGWQWFGVDWLMGLGSMCVIPSDFLLYKDSCMRYGIGRSTDINGVFLPSTALTRKQ